MYPSISATQWGSPTAPRKALLIHRLTSCSSAWEGVAQLLVAEGFHRVLCRGSESPWHAWRRGTDYRISTLAEDLRPYFINDTSYDVVIGRSLGGTVALSLLPFLPKTKEVTVILLDPPLEREGTAEMDKSWFLEAIANVKTAEELVGEFGWSRRDCVLAALGVSMCDRTTIDGIFSHNRPWSFSGLFKNIPPHVKVTVLVSDPKAGAVCHVEHVPRDIERLNVRVLPGIGHCIHYECPEAIMDAI
ncbi:Alpha/Beta hydrolase protein [Suillus subalutaceus]|uniref:Alpha/Beta hydrolase protein n=1 Tax=Suillus subalutaceus TaxID=48586 RepID=UPI001B86F495|nr:Alpha/Beta hydrolase protein [Suillus subalutaceus]KAG1836399.1 Alpha/Beta hydrolase protein [Suillus subalutaceus]